MHIVLGTKMVFWVAWEGGPVCYLVCLHTESKSSNMTFFDVISHHAFLREPVVCCQGFKTKFYGRVGTEDKHLAEKVEIDGREIVAYLFGSSREAV